jgi:hypothetical protein
MQHLQRSMNQQQQLKEKENILNGIDSSTSGTSSLKKSNIRVPKHVSNILSIQCEDYMPIARRNMSESAIDIDPSHLVACDPFETTSLSCSYVVLDALPPSFAEACRTQRTKTADVGSGGSEAGSSSSSTTTTTTSSGNASQAAFDQVKMMMERLECYYARMCSSK